MRKRKRKQKSVKALALFSFLEILTVILWEYALAGDVSSYSVIPAAQVLVTGTALSAVTGLVYWALIRKRYQRSRRRHVMLQPLEDVPGQINFDAVSI